MMKHLRFLTLAIALCSMLACSTAKKNPADSGKDPGESIASAHDLSFEISYSLGKHGLHRIAGNVGSESSWPNGDPRVATYDEREIIDEGAVHPDKYRHFVEKIFSFTQTAQRAPSQDGDCRAPYTIILKINGKTYTSKGCRAAGEKSFGALVREGEFLLYSKK